MGTPTDIGGDRDSDEGGDARGARGVSVVLPALNEDANIGPMIDATASALTALDLEHEIIVVDDGSTDSTLAVARERAASQPRLLVLSHGTNRGYGAAIRTGFAAATKELVFYTDADRQFDVGDLGEFLPMIADNDLVVGYRIDRNDPVVRSIFSWGYNRLVGLLFRIRIRDVNCAFKLLRREVLEGIQLQSDDFFIDTEIIAMARKRNFRIAQKGVRHYPRVAGSTTVRASDTARTLRSAAVMWRRIHQPAPGSRG